MLRGRVDILYVKVRESITDKVTYGQRHKGREEVIQENTWEGYCR